MNCTRCEGSGFLNLDQVDLDQVGEMIAAGEHGVILDWIADQKRQQDAIGGCSCFQHPPCSFCMLRHDVQVCDCCGDGCNWYGTPGEHNTQEPIPECG